LTVDDETKSRLTAETCGGWMDRFRMLWLTIDA
jgi:hypothetical protein